MNVSTLIGKPVLSPAGETLGYLTAAYLSKDLKRIASLAAADADEEEFFLPFRAVRAANDAVIASRTRAEHPSGIPCPIGKPAYTHTGEYLGIVCDFFPQDDTPARLAIALGKEVRHCDIACVALNETVIVYPDAESKRAGGRRPARRCVPEGAILPGTKSDAMSEERPTPTAMSAPPPDHTVSAATGMFRIDRVNLIGRRVKHSVFDETGAPVALAGERITPETIADARRKNRLLTLTVNTLTNVY